MHILKIYCTLLHLITRRKIIKTFDYTLLHVFTISQIGKSVITCSLYFLIKKIQKENKFQIVFTRNYANLQLGKKP